MEARFSATVPNGTGAHQPPIHCVPGLFPCGKAPKRDVKQSYTLTPLLDLSGLSRVNFTSTFNHTEDDSANAVFNMLGTDEKCMQHLCCNFGIRTGCLTNWITVTRYRGIAQALWAACPDISPRFVQRFCLFVFVNSWRPTAGAEWIYTHARTHLFWSQWTWICFPLWSLSKRVKMYCALRVRSPPRVQLADPLALRTGVWAAGLRPVQTMWQDESYEHAKGYVNVTRQIGISTKMVLVIEVFVVFSSLSRQIPE